MSFFLNVYFQPIGIFLRILKLDIGRLACNKEGNILRGKDCKESTIWKSCNLLETALLWLILIITLSKEMLLEGLDSGYLVKISVEIIWLICVFILSYQIVGAKVNIFKKPFFLAKPLGNGPLNLVPIGVKSLFDNKIILFSDHK